MCIHATGMAHINFYLIICFRLPPPASKEAVKNLPDVTIKEVQEDKNCPICLKVFQLGDKVKQMPCEHAFHSTCILIWLERVSFSIFLECSQL